MTCLRDISVGIAVLLMAFYGMRTQVLLDRQRTIITQACLTNSKMAMLVDGKMTTFKCVKEEK